LPELVPPNNTLFAGTVPANNTLFAGTANKKFYFSFFSSLLYGTPAPSAERQHTEAWPASTFGHLRGVSRKIVPANKVLFAGTVPENNLFVKFNFKFVSRLTWF